jgi:hypothetical protein
LNFPGRVASLNAQDLIWVFVHRFLSKVLKAPGSCLGSIYNWFRPALVNVTLSRLNSNVFPDVPLSFAQFEREVTGERSAHFPQISLLGWRQTGVAGSTTFR